MDVNQTAFNQAINFPTAAWTPAILNVLKTEGFGFTLGRDAGWGGDGDRRFARVSGGAAEPSGGDRGSDDAVAEGGAERGGAGVRERGAVRAGSVLFDRVWAAAAGGVEEEFADGAVGSVAEGGSGEV